MEQTNAGSHSQLNKNNNDKESNNDTTNNDNNINNNNNTNKEPLPKNRFELELEFVQCLASPAYIHFLTTCKTEEGDRLLLQDVLFQQFLQYLLRTWSLPEYSRYLSYPHALYFLELLIEKPSVVKEWTMPEFRNFCHQQQFLSWQHRHAKLYGRGKTSTSSNNNNDNDNNNKNNMTTTNTNDNNGTTNGTEMEL